MSEGGAADGRASRRRRRTGLRLSGLLSLALFFVPLIAPFIQLATLVFVVAAVRRRDLDGWSLALGAGGPLLGLVLHLMTQFVWIV